MRCRRAGKIDRVIPLRSRPAIARRRDRARRARQRRAVGRELFLRYASRRAPDMCGPAGRYCGDVRGFRGRDQIDEALAVRLRRGGDFRDRHRPMRRAALCSARRAATRKIRRYSRAEQVAPVASDRDIGRAGNAETANTGAGFSRARKSETPATARPRFIETARCVSPARKALERPGRGLGLRHAVQRLRAADAQLWPIALDREIPQIGEEQKADESRAGEDRQPFEEASAS